MSRFSVDTDALRNAAGRCEDISDNLRALAVSIIYVKNSLEDCMGNYSGVFSALDTCIINTSNCSKKVGIYGERGTSIADKYLSSEETVAGNIEYDKFGNIIVPGNGAGYSIEQLLQAIGAIAAVGLLINPVTAPITSALLNVIDFLYGDEPTDAEVKLKSKVVDKELKKIHESNDYADAAGFKKIYDPKKKEWVDEPKKDDKKKPDVSVEVKLKEWEAKAEGSLVHGEVTAKGDLGNASAKLDVLKGEAHADAYVGLLAAGASAGVSVTAISGELSGQLGNDNLGLHGSVTGTIGRAGAEVEAKAALFDKNGNLAPTLKAEASAEAIAAEVSGTVGVNIAGADVGVTGTAQVGVGAHASFGFDEGKLTADVGAALGVGFSVKVEVDLSKPVNAICDGARSVMKFFGF